MGDRANIYLKQGGKGPGIYFYSHWGGYDLPVTLRDALVRGKERWDDEPYLARIIFDQMAGGENGLTGFGISTYPTDNEYDLLVVDSEAGTVSVTKFPFGSDEERGAMSFSEFIKLTDAKAKEFRDGPSEEEAKP